MVQLEEATQSTPLAAARSKCFQFIFPVAVMSAAFLPTTRMATAVHDSDRRDMILGYHVVHDIRKSSEWRFADVIDRDGVLLGITFDQFQRGSDCVREFVAKTGSASFVPLECLRQIATGGITKKQGRH
jgi:hypothetical protein